MKLNEKRKRQKIKFGSVAWLLSILLIGIGHLSAQNSKCVFCNGPLFVQVGSTAQFSGSCSSGDHSPYTFSSPSSNISVDANTGIVTALTASSAEADEEVDVYDSKGKKGTPAYITCYEIDSETVMSAPGSTAWDSRLTVGIGERVKLWVVPDLGVTWETDGGSNGSIDDLTSSPTHYTASTEATTETITATLDSGDSGMITFTVIAAYIVNQQTDTGADNNPVLTSVPCTRGMAFGEGNGELGIDSYRNVFLGPDSVSFYYAVWGEGGCAPDPCNGYFQGRSLQYHIPSSPVPALQPYAGAPGKGTEMDDDEVKCTGNPGPYINGVFTWSIPWFTGVDVADQSIDTFDDTRTMSITGLSTSDSGTLNVSKDGVSNEVSN